MGDIPKVSIVIPVKGGKSLLNALDSVKNQEYHRWECLVIDDGIDQDVLEQLKQYSAEDNRFRLLQSTGKGISAALNTGILSAKGEYIARLDDDDRWYPYHLAMLVGILDKHENIDIIGSLVDIVWTPRRYLQLHVTNPYTMLVHKNPFNHPSVVYRKALVLKQETLYDTNCDGFEDYELWSRVLTPTNGLILQMPTIVYAVGNVNKEKWWFSYLVFRHNLCKRFSQEFNTKFYVEQVIYSD